MSAEPSQRPTAASGLSFQGRITVAAMTTAVVVLLAACIAFVAEQWRTDQHDRRAEQMAAAEVLAHTRALRNAATGRDDPRAVMGRVLALKPNFRAAFLVDPQGEVLGGFGAATPAAARADGLVELRTAVTEGDRNHAFLLTYAPPPSILSILPRYLALTAALFFAATGLALFLGRWLAARVSEPVEQLSQAMRAVAESGDFDQQVQRLSEDELGRLTDSFNALLAKLRDNDLALRRTMNELVDARDAAESANRLKSQFLANMSHEIRTPLNGLLAMSQVMAIDELAPAQRERLEVVRQSGEALLAILNDVLDVSKIEAGK